MDCVLNIKDSKITNRTAISDFFKSLADGRYLLKAEHIKKRSLPQNAYYWGVVVPMVKDGLRAVGYNEVKTNSDAHEILKHLFLKKTYKSELQDEPIVIAGSTSDLKTVAFNEFLEDIWQWAATYLNIHIPAPNEQTILFATRDFDINATIVTR